MTVPTATPPTRPARRRRPTGVAGTLATAHTETREELARANATALGHAWHAVITIEPEVCI